MSYAQDENEIKAQLHELQRGQYAAKLRNAFEWMDEDNSGSISYQEFTECLEDEEVQACFKELGIAREQQILLFRMMDPEEAIVWKLKSS